MVFSSTNSSFSSYNRVQQRFTAAAQQAPEPERISTLPFTPNRRPTVKTSPLLSPIAFVRGLGVRS